MNEKPTIILSGGGISSEFEAEGHGISLHTGDLLSSLEPVDFHVVLNHDYDIQAIAGQGRMVGADTGQLRRKTYARDEEGTLIEAGERVDTVAIARFQAELSPDFQGYDAAVSHIKALQARGRVPHVSMSFRGTALEYDEETDTVYFRGPYSFRHLGLVDTGALKPEQGVGVFSVTEEFKPGGGDLVVSMGQAIDSAPIHMTASARCENADELMVAFAEKHLGTPVYDRVAAIFGVREEIEEEEVVEEEKPVRGAAAATPSGGLRFGDATVAHASKPDSYGLRPLSEPTNMSGEPSTPMDSEESFSGDENMTSNNQPEHEEPVTALGAIEGDGAMAEVPVKASPEKSLSMKEVELLLEEKLAARDERIASLEAERDSAREAQLAERRARIAQQYGVEDETLAVFTTKEQLDAFEKSLGSIEARPAALPRSTFGPRDETEADKMKQAEEDAKAWHESVYIGGAN